MSSWSFSGYSTALQCLRKYKYAFIDKLIPDAPHSGDMQFGTCLHSALNASLNGKEGVPSFKEYWELFQEKELEYGRFKWRELYNLGSEFIRKFEKSHKRYYKLIFAEKRLYAEYKGVKFEGTPDFYGEYDGKLSVRDFKTSGYNYKEEKSQIAIQLYLYAYLCIKNAMPLSDNSVLGYTVFNKGTGSIQDLTWRFEEKKMYEVLDDLVAYVGILDNKDSYPKNLNSCLDYNRRCQYYEICHGKGDSNE